MAKLFFPAELTLSSATKAFVAATSTESGEHIKPLHRYLCIRLVIEGGFLPEELSPRPPLESENRNGKWHLSFNASKENAKERIVLGALKSKRIDIVVVKPGIGPVLAVSVKGTSKAFRNLVNRTEEAIGDCANIHIMYPGLVYGFIHFLRATQATDSTLKSNDIFLNEDGKVIPSAKDYARILEGLTGRRLVRNEYSRYESIGLAALRVDATKGKPSLLTEFPGVSSPLSIDAFFQTLYNVYDLRFAYPYSDPGVGNLERVVWDQDSQAVLALRDAGFMSGLLEYAPRISNG